MLLALRESYSVASGPIGVGQLMALAARPPFRGTLKPTDGGVKVIRHWARSRYHRDFGHDHPIFPRCGKQGLATREASLNHLFMDFGKAVDAGRLFLSSLAAKNPQAIRTGKQIVFFRHEGAILKSEIPAVPHTEALAVAVAEHAARLAYEKVDSHNIRQARWDRWLPTIHISAAFAWLHDFNVQVQGPMPWGTFAKSILSEDNGDLTWVVAQNANKLLQAAEDCSFFPKANPRPVLLRDQLAQFLHDRRGNDMTS
jgi:hypothetical protein